MAEIYLRRAQLQDLTVIMKIIDDAKELVRLLKGMLCHVNLIPVNDVEERGNVRSTDKSIKNFCETLYSLGINATIRRTLGSDINASCGQLRRKKNEGGNI